MRFDSPLESVTLLRRYKRFLADVLTADGTTMTVHVPNSGRMTSCLGERWPAWVSCSNNPRRKLSHTLELVDAGSSLIVVNTLRANQLAEEALRAGRIAALRQYSEWRREVNYGEDSRIDLLGCDANGALCYVEVKSVTLLTEEGTLAFPDAPSQRARKHMRELEQMVIQGHRAVVLFVAMREDADRFRPATDIDPAYATALKEAVSRGVELMVWQASVSPHELELVREISYDLL